MYDCVVIGGGVVGGTVLRELTKYDLRAVLLEKENDVGMGASRANSGIVHAGFDAPPNTNKAKFNVAGNKMMPTYCADLGVKYRNNGSLVVAFSDEDKNTLHELKKRGEKNGVTGLQILDAKALKTKEPHISAQAIGALYAPTGGIVCPYELTVAAIGNAMDNGADLLTDFDVEKIEKKSDGFHVYAADGRSVTGKLLLNCAGLAGGKIAALAGDESIRIYPRKGEYILLDRESGDYISHTLFFAPTKRGKGVLISQTVDNNVIVGPTAIEQDGTETTAEGLGYIGEKSREMCPDLPLYNTITSFAGVRAYSDRHDFVIEESATVDGLIHCVGIESPGLTSAPAIAEYVASTLVAKHIALKKNDRFDPIRQPDCFFKNLSTEEKNAVIKRDPAYGKIVCRCEQVTEGEIVRAIRENPPAKSVDAVKRRTRSGMGRCQGGFCQPHIAEILARELGIRFEDVTKSGKGSQLVREKTK